MSNSWPSCSTLSRMNLWRIFTGGFPWLGDEAALGEPCADALVVLVAQQADQAAGHAVLVMGIVPGVGEDLVDPALDQGAALHLGMVPVQAGEDGVLGEVQRGSPWG